MKPDADVVVATADLVGRTGARDFEIGYHEDEPAQGALNWYAQASYRGSRLFAEGRDPTEAAEGLARRLLTGAKCAHCGGLVALSDAGAVGFEEQGMVDGTRWTMAEQLAAGLCRWTREGRRWKRGCEDGSEPAPARMAIKVGRNDPCPCGSDRKWKRCHGSVRS